MADEYTSAKLTLHPAFSETIPLPIAVLYHQELGLGYGQTLYLIHILAAQIRGDFPINQGAIARNMGVDQRTIRKYSKKLEDMGMLVRIEQFQNGIQVENNYDLDAWLSRSLSISRNQSKQAVDNLIGRLKQVKNLDELRVFIESYAPPGSYDPPPPGSYDPPPPGSYDPPPPGSYDPPPPGSYDPPPPGGNKGDHMIPPNDDDDQYIFNSSINKSSSSFKHKSPVEALLSLTGKNGNRFSRETANYLAYQSMRLFGAEAADVIYCWVEFAANNPAVRDAPAFVRVKLGSGERPPAPTEEEAERCNNCGRPFSTISPGHCLYCAGVIAS